MTQSSRAPYNTNWSLQFQCPSASILLIPTTDDKFFQKKLQVFKFLIIKIIHTHRKKKYLSTQIRKLKATVIPPYWVNEGPPLLIQIHQNPLDATLLGDRAFEGRMKTKISRRSHPVVEWPLNPMTGACPKVREDTETQREGHVERQAEITVTLL